MVSSLNPKDPSILSALQRDDTSVLDLVMDSAKAVRSRGSASDRVRLDEYFESVRSVEQRLQTAMRPQKRWIKYGSRVLLSLIEQSKTDRDAILEAIFSRSRGELVAGLQRAGGGPARETARRALRAHDYVYDVFEATEGVAA